MVPIALVFGFIVGAAAVLLISLAIRRGHEAAGVANTVVPDGVDQVLEALESAAVVVDASNTVIKATPGALAIGLVWHHRLAHTELVRLIDGVRRSGVIATEQLSLARGPYGDANVVLRVRAARLGSRYMLLLAEDRTESIRLEEVRRDFVANISHELKTPIGAITVLSEAIDAASDDPEQVQRFVSRLGKEAERLGRITQDVIELSRLQAGEALAKPELLSLDQIIAAAVDQNRVAAEAHRINVVVGGTPGVHVYGDRGMLTMAVQNLVANAIQYSPDGSRVGIGVGVDDETIEIAVTDQGVGIPDDDLDRVFERFFRVDPARSRNTGGTGLGLSIVKHVVQNHGGDIRVWSHPGRGSTFTIRLPEAEAPSVAATGERTA